MQKQIVSVGDLVVDLVLDIQLPAVIDGHQMSPTLVFEPGGAASTIFAARHMGLDVTAVGTVGTDFQGQMIQQVLDAVDVDTSPLVIKQNSTTTTVIALNDTQQDGHVFIGHYGIGDLIDMTPLAQDKLLNADAVFMPGYTAVEARLQPLVTRTFELIDTHQLRFYLDVGPFMGQMPYDRVESILKLVDVLLLTENEVPYVAQGKTGIQACQSLIDTYPDLTIVLKTGAKGCHILTSNETITCAGYVVDVVDTIGAGDAFAGAFMWAHLNGLSLAECGMVANAMGAATVQIAGAGRNVPSCAKVQAILDANNIPINL